jgi:hypothetical protein
MRNSTRSIVPLFLFVFVFTFAFMVSVGTPQNAGACVKVCDCKIGDCHAAYVWVMGEWRCSSYQCVQPGTCTPYPPCEQN